MITLLLGKTQTFWHKLRLILNTKSWIINHKMVYSNLRMPCMSDLTIFLMPWKVFLFRYFPSSQFIILKQCELWRSILVSKNTFFFLGKGAHFGNGLREIPQSQSSVFKRRYSVMLLIKNTHKTQIIKQSSCSSPAFCLHSHIFAFAESHLSFFANRLVFVTCLYLHFHCWQNTELLSLSKLFWFE